MEPAGGGGERRTVRIGIARIGRTFAVAGSSPTPTAMAAITAATLNAARAIGIEATHGSIALGKVGDLVVLSANPSADISHARDIVYVFRQGRRFEPRRVVSTKQ